MNQYLLFSLSISKAKQFQIQLKKIQESNENLQVKDKEYLREQNVDLLTNGVVNKILEKDVDRIFN